VGLPEDPVDTPLRGFMFPGLHIFEPRIFEWMRSDASYSVIRETYPRLLRGGERIYGFVTTARWVTIDTPEELIAAADVLSRSPFRF
jgi:NDP-sugar pyrophosphorylase family protein